MDGLLERRWEMDPEQAVADMVIAACSGEWITMLETAEGLASWLQKGGYNPEIEIVFKRIDHGRP